MVRWIVDSSLRARRVLVALAVAVLVLGGTALAAVPVDVLPEFAPPTVEIQTEARGLSAAEVEQLITVPMEQDLLNGVAFLHVIHSESVPGLSSVELVFEPGTDLLHARQVVQERVSQAAGLPNVSAPPQILQPRSSTSRAMMIGLSSRKLSPIELSVLTRYTIRPRLMGVAGVANVAVWGQRDRQLQVQADPERLRAHGVTLDQLINTTGNALQVSTLSFLEASTPGTGGFIDTANQRLGIRHVSPIVDAADLAQVVIDEKPGLRLSDVADVVEDHQPLIGDAVLGDGPGLLLVVEKLPGANTLEVTRGVDQALAALAPGLTDVQVDSSLYRPAAYVHTAMSNVATALLIGAGLVLALLLGGLFLPWRSALVSAAAVACSLAAAVGVLYLTGTTLNALVLAGLVLAVGVLVDDAVGDVEHLARRLRRRRAEGADSAAVVGVAALEIRSSLGYATLIIAVTLVPLFVTRGLTDGAFLPTLALSYGLAVLASLVVALTVTPALGLLLLGGAAESDREPAVLRGVQRAYRAALVRTAGAARPALVAVGVALLAGVALFGFLGQSLQPSFKDPSLLIRLDAMAGTSEPEMTRITEQAGRELRTMPGVQRVGTHVGRAVSGDQVVGVNSGELWVSLDPATDIDAAAASIHQVINGYPGLRGAVLNYPGQRIDADLAGPAAPVVVRVYGQDLDVLHSKAEEVRAALSGIDGVVDGRVEQHSTEPNVEIEVNLTAAQNFGIKPGDVRRAASAMLSGISVGSLFDQQKIFDVVVWSTPQTRASLTDIRALLIDTPLGGQVRLGDVADVRVRPSPTVIRHDASSRSIDVTANIRGRGLGAVAADVQTRLGQIQFPLEYHAELLGGSADQQAARTRLLAFSAGAAVLVFLLLQAAFGSWRLAGLVFLTLPGALVGGVLAVFADGGVLSLGSAVGFLAVFALAVRHAVLLIRHYQRLETQDGEQPGPGLVLRGARDRLAPVAVTTLGAALAMLPLVITGSVPGLEIVHPMAVVVLGGLVSSALLTLFLLPALYLRYAPRPTVDV